jgi:hypothetical protein
MHDDDALDREQEHDAGLDPDAPEEYVQAYDGDEPWAATDEEPEWVEEPSQRLGPAALAGTFFLGVVTCLVLVLIWGAFTGGDAEGEATDEGGLARESQQLDTMSSEAEDSGTGASSMDGHSGPTRLSRCASAARNLQDSLDAAQPALDQWAVHVGAMNKLVVGELTLQQATDFWESTRLGAQRNIAAYRDTVETLRRQGVDCPSPALLAPGARALPGCTRQVEAQVGVLRAATTSIDTWDEHVRHMDMMRLGTLTPEEATQMWLSMWQEGARDLDAYESAAGSAQKLDGCSSVGGVD